MERMGEKWLRGLHKCFNILILKDNVAMDGSASRIHPSLRLIAHVMCVSTVSRHNRGLLSVFSGRSGRIFTVIPGCRPGVEGSAQVGREDLKRGLRGRRAAVASGRP